MSGTALANEGDRLSTTLALWRELAVRAWERMNTSVSRSWNRTLVSYRATKASLRPASIDLSRVKISMP